MPLDLNPNEQVWEILKWRLRPRFPPPSTKHQIMEFLVEEWCRFKSLYASVSLMAVTVPVNYGPDSDPS
jgi:transposase